MAGCQEVWKTKFGPWILSQMILQWLLVIWQMYGPPLYLANRVPLHVIRLSLCIIIPSSIYLLLNQYPSFVRPLWTPCQLMLLSFAFHWWEPTIRATFRKRIEFLNPGWHENFLKLYDTYLRPTVCFMNITWMVVPRGWLLIAEVKSRLDPNTRGADPNKLLKAICELGFTTESKVSSNWFQYELMKSMINL